MPYIINTGPRILTIAGSDSSAGAGIQADIKTISALGGYACTAITAVTVQNTQGVHSLNPVSADVIAQQCIAIFEDIKIDAVKIGMLPDIDSIEAVAGVLKKYQPGFIVWDPVMVATSGDSLVTEKVVDTLIEVLLPLAHVVTPNLQELAELTNSPEQAVADEAMVKAQAIVLLNRGSHAVLAKGGHLQSNEAIDWLVTQDMEQRFAKPKIKTHNTHGSGCTYSSAIACLRPQLPNLIEAVAAAKNYVQGAIIDAVNWKLGKGSGPLSHFHSGIIGR